MLDDWLIFTVYITWNGNGMKMHFPVLKLAETCAHFNEMGRTHVTYVLGAVHGIQNKWREMFIYYKHTHWIYCFYDQFKMNGWWLSRLTTKIAYILILKTIIVTTDDILILPISLLKKAWSGLAFIDFSQIWDYNCLPNFW